MAKGIADSVGISRLTGGLASGGSPKKNDDPVGRTVVGDGNTSVKREGGPFCASLPHIALPHGNEVLFE